jgi:hypothetical protein
MLLNIKRYTKHITTLVATKDYADIAKSTTGKLQALSTVNFTDITYNGNHLIFNGTRCLGYLNKIIVHEFKHRLTPKLANFYIQGNGISYSGSDLMLAEISNLINRTFTDLRITEVTTIAHALLDGIVTHHEEQAA